MFNVDTHHGIELLPLQGKQHRKENPLEGHLFQKISYSKKPQRLSLLRLTNAMRRPNPKMENLDHLFDATQTDSVGYWLATDKRAGQLFYRLVSDFMQSKKTKDVRWPMAWKVFLDRYQLTPEEIPKALQMKTYLEALSKPRFSSKIPGLGNRYTLTPSFLLAIRIFRRCVLQPHGPGGVVASGITREDLFDNDAFFKLLNFDKKAIKAYFVTCDHSDLSSGGPKVSTDLGMKTDSDLEIIKTHSKKAMRESHFHLARTVKSYTLESLVSHHTKTHTESNALTTAQIERVQFHFLEKKVTTYLKKEKKASQNKNPSPGTASISPKLANTLTSLMIRHAKTHGHKIIEHTMDLKDVGQSQYTTEDLNKIPSSLGDKKYRDMVAACQDNTRAWSSLKTQFGSSLDFLGNVALQGTIEDALLNAPINFTKHTLAIVNGESKTTQKIFFTFGLLKTKKQAETIAKKVMEPYKDKSDAEYEKDCVASALGISPDNAYKLISQIETKGTVQQKNALLFFATKRIVDVRNLYSKKGEMGKLGPHIELMKAACEKNGIESVPIRCEMYTDVEYLIHKNLSISDDDKQVMDVQCDAKSDAFIKAFIQNAEILMSLASDNIKEQDFAQRRKLLEQIKRHYDKRNTSRAHAYAFQALFTQACPFAETGLCKSSKDRTSVALCMKMMAQRLVDLGSDPAVLFSEETGELHWDLLDKEKQDCIKNILADRDLLHALNRLNTGEKQNASPDGFFDVMSQALDGITGLRSQLGATRLGAAGRVLLPS